MQKPSWIDAAEYPFRSRYVDLPAGRMHYVDSGHGQPILLLLHGNPTWSFEYRNVIRRFSGDFRCLAPDWFGFGLSDRPPDFGYRPEDHARSLLRFISALDVDRVVLIAHDWGGPIGLSAAFDQPSRFVGIVLSNTWLWPPIDLRTLLFTRLAGSLPGRLLIEEMNALVHLMPLAFGKPSRLSKPARRHYIDAQYGPRDGAARFPAAFLASAGWLDELRGRCDALADIPKSIVWGMRDPVIRPINLQRWLEIYPDANVTELPDVGHFVAEEAPARMAYVIQNLIAEMSGS